MDARRTSHHRVRLVGMRGRLPVLAAVAAALLLAPAAHAKAKAPRAPVANTALILASTVTPGTATDGSGKSLEQQQAEADGFTVTLVDDPTWSSMTASQFAAYRVIIIGDPRCSDTVGAGSVVQSNASVWEPVVMASGGNRVLIGTDPTLHNNGPSGTQRGDLLEKNTIAFAGAVPGATGLYMDLSCTYDGSPAGTPVPILDGLSTHGAGQFTAIGEGPINACATNVNIVAATAPTSSLLDANLSNWNCSVHEAFDKFPSDYTPLVLAPTTTGFPNVYCANDVETGTLACGSPYVMVAGSGVTPKSNVTLTPPSQVLTVGGSASLVANVVLSAGGGPVVGGSVVFNVDSGPNVGKSVAGTTDSSGNTTFTYSDTGGKGTDSVSATYTSSGGIQKATATVTWNPATVGPPTATITTPPNGATYNKGQVVNASYLCADAAGGPGIASCNGSVANGSPIDTSTVGPHTFTVTATSLDGQTGTAMSNYTVIGPPTATIVTPPNGASYTQGQVVNASYSCADATGGPGIASCTGPVANGSPIDTSTVGLHTFTVTATSLDGQTGTATSDYTVTATTSGCRMSGEGFFGTHPVDSVSAALSSDLTKSQHLRFVLSGKTFVLTTLTSAVCQKEPGLNPGPGHMFNSLKGAGSGTYGGASGFTVKFELSDGGQRGAGNGGGLDRVTVRLFNSHGALVVSVRARLSSTLLPHGGKPNLVETDGS